jgi:hypothetical protein
MAILINLLVLVVIIGVCYWLLTLIMPLMPPPFGTIILVLFVLICLIFFLNTVGFIGSGPVLRVYR